MYIYPNDEFELEVNGEEQKLTIHHDDGLDSPREFSPLTTIFSMSKKIPNEAKLNKKDGIAFTDPDVFMTNILSTYIKDKDKIGEMTTVGLYGKAKREKELQNFEILKEYGILMKFLYIYDHSGIAISLHDFKDPWDSGICGIVYVTKEEVIKEQHATEDNWLEKAEEIMEAEIEIYSLYIEGDVTGYTIEKEEICPHCGKIMVEVLDSCGGFYGHDIEKNGMLDHLPTQWEEYFKEKINAKIQNEC